MGFTYFFVPSLNAYLFIYFWLESFEATHHIFSPINSSICLSSRQRYFEKHHYNSIIMFNQMYSNSFSCQKLSSIAYVKNGFAL